MMTIAPPFFHARKFAFMIPVLLLVLLAYRPASAGETARQIQDQVERLQKVADGLKTLHDQLQINKDEVFRLHERANDNIQGNILKVYIKGSMDIYNRITAPMNGIVELLTEVFLNLYLEPVLWTIKEDRVALLALSRQASRENARLALLYAALGEVMQQDAKRFDDDMPPLPYTRNWWGDPDGQKDPEIERVTRKLRIIRELSHTVYLRTDAEMARVRDERRMVLAQIAKRTPELAQRKAEETRQNEEMARWRQSRKERQARQAPVAGGDGRGPEADEDFASDRPPADASGETPAQRTARLKKAQAGQARLGKERLAREKVQYTSQPITNYLPAYPAAGMFALADGTGFHVYQTEKTSAEPRAGVVYIVTRMKGAEVKILHRLPVNGLFRMVPSPDNRYWTITYTEDPRGTQKSIILN